jgi:hypothetical protein
MGSELVCMGSKDLEFDADSKNKHLHCSKGIVDVRTITRKTRNVTRL